jgi:molecular chaperone HscB
MRIASDQSALLNTAYNTLRDPLLRARYLIGRELKLNSSDEEADKMHDVELIAQVMDAREDVDTASTKLVLQTLDKENQGERTDVSL